MIKYKINFTEDARPLAVMSFEDSKYDLLGEFLLAERSFRREILATVNEVDLGTSYKEYFSGNVFTLRVTPDYCDISSDLDDDDRGLRLETPEFKKILLDYIYALRELSVKEKMSTHHHHHHHNHE